MNQTLKNNEIWIVEFRQHQNNPYDSYYFTSDVAYIASSFDKAREFCRENIDYDSHDTDHWWWFTIYNDQLDSDWPSLIVATTLFHVDWFGNATNNGLGNEQPIEGYEVKEIVVSDTVRKLEEAIDHYEHGLFEARRVLQTLARHGRFDEKSLREAQEKAINAELCLSQAANAHEKVS